MPHTDLEKALIKLIHQFRNCGKGTDGDEFWEDYDKACIQAEHLVPTRKKK